MDEKLSKLYSAHCEEADHSNAEFYNLGWSQGDRFIHSKTDKGRLWSEIDEKGNITHEWQDMKGNPIPVCILCKAVIYGHGHNPAPLANTGKACEDCNVMQVIPARLKTT